MAYSKPNMIAHAYDPSTQEDFCEFKASLSYIKSLSKKEKKKERTSTKRVSYPQAKALSRQHV